MQPPLLNQPSQQQQHLKEDTRVEIDAGVDEEKKAEEEVVEETMAVDPVVDAEAILAIVKPVMDEQLNALLAMIAEIKNQLEEVMTTEIEDEVEMSEAVALSAHQRFSNVNKFINK